MSWIWEQSVADNDWVNRGVTTEITVSVAHEFCKIRVHNVVNVPTITRRSREELNCRLV